MLYIKNRKSFHNLQYEEMNNTEKRKFIYNKQLYVQTPKQKTIQTWKNVRLSFVRYLCMGGCDWDKYYVNVSVFLFEHICVYIC